MLPNTRELVWFGLGVATVMFIIPFVKGALASKSSGPGQ